MKKIALAVLLLCAACADTGAAGSSASPVRGSGFIYDSKAQTVEASAFIYDASAPAVPASEILYK